MCDGVAIVTVTGELDFALCVKLAPELNTAVRSAARAVVIDLEAVSLVDSSGIALLLNVFRRLDHAGRQLAIACPMGSPRRAFEITAVDRWLPLHETRPSRIGRSPRQLTAVAQPVALSAPSDMASQRRPSRLPRRFTARTERPVRMRLQRDISGDAGANCEICLPR